MVESLSYSYDAKSRRVRKVTPTATHAYFYDDWNLIEERVAYTNGTASTIHYCWGKDLSGTLQGAGGVGGLLYLTVDDTIYVPFYDNNGNITRYLDSSGNTVAQYTYDAFGNTISQSGPLADFFRHRFSTKYFDPETGFYYYGYRFYLPNLMRWLNRDPIEENGGANLYAFCENYSLRHIDLLGEARMLTGALFALKDGNRLPYPGYSIARSIIRLIDNLNSIRKNGKKIFDAKICDFATASLSSIQKEVSENPDHTYFIAHGGISNNGRTFAGSTYVWNRGDGAIELIFPKGNQTAGIPVSSLGPKLNYGNVLGCFLSPRVRKTVVGPWYNKRTESSWDTYEEMYKALYNRLLRYKAGGFTGCIKIRVYEGENNNEYSKPYAETNNAMINYPIRTEEEYQ